MDQTKISDSYKNAIHQAISGLIAEGKDKVELPHPNNGEYVSFVKPGDETKVFETYSSKDFGADNNQAIYLVVENPMGKRI